MKKPIENSHLDLEKIKQQALALEMHYGIFKSLFSIDVQRSNILNSHFPILTNVLFNSVLDSLILRIARLLDPPETGRNHNFVLDRLIPGMENETRKTEAQVLLKRINELSRNVREHRNKRIAHQDYDSKTTVYNTHPLILCDIKELVEEIYKFLAMVGDSELGFGFITSDCESEINHLISKIKPS